MRVFQSVVNLEVSRDDQTKVRWTPAGRKVIINIPISELMMLAVSLIFPVFSTGFPMITCLEKVCQKVIPLKTKFKISRATPKMEIALA